LSPRSGAVLLSLDGPTPRPCAAGGECPPVRPEGAGICLFTRAGIWVFFYRVRSPRDRGVHCPGELAGGEPVVDHATAHAEALGDGRLGQAIIEQMLKEHE